MKEIRCISTRLTISFSISCSKGGILTLTSLIVASGWLLRHAFRAVTKQNLEDRSVPAAGMGVILLAFWPLFVLVNLLGEEMFTDNLQLHWTILFGVLIGSVSWA